MIVEGITMKLKRDQLSNSSGPSPQVLVDVSNPARMKNMSTGLCYAGCDYWDNTINYCLY